MTLLHDLSLIARGLARKGSMLSGRRCLFCRADFRHLGVDGKPWRDPEHHLRSCPWAKARLLYPAEPFDEGE